MKCRYLAAPGTRTRQSSPFGDWLRNMGVELPPAMSLAHVVSRGWVEPVLRVPLPQAAFDAWKNFPVISPIQVEGCPSDCEWAISLYITAMSGAWPGNGSVWWLADLDDLGRELTQAARAHAVSADDAAALPPAFRHARCNQEIHPWIDYFAYWQAFQVTDYVRHMSKTYCLTDPVDDDVAGERAGRATRTENTHEYLRRKWKPRQRTFEWLSRMRTVLGCSVSPFRRAEEINDALKSVAAGLGMTVDAMKTDTRETLLRMWKDMADAARRHHPFPEPLVRLLRQEVQYAVYFIEHVGGEAVDFLDPFWSSPVRHDGIAQLVEALPHEEELARREFPWHAELYMRQPSSAVPQLCHLDRRGLRALIETHWHRSRSLRRFALAFHRLHEELGGERLTAEEKVIRETERIEQFNLVAMHAERVLTSEYRDRQPQSQVPGVNDLVLDTLTHVLQKWQHPANGQVDPIVQKVSTLLKQHGKLYTLHTSPTLRMVVAADVASGCAAADVLAAAFANLIIARNYAAHHDALDFDLVYPTTIGKDHPGALALKSAMTVVSSVLLAR